MKADKGGKVTWELGELIMVIDFRYVLYSRESLQYYLRKKYVLKLLDWRMSAQFLIGRRGPKMEIYVKKTPTVEKEELFKLVMYLWPRTYTINWMWRCMSKIDDPISERFKLTSIGDLIERSGT